MRILATITDTEIKDNFIVITAKDVRNWYHTLYFNKEKRKQIEKEYGTKNIIGLTCILENTECGRISRFIQTDLDNEQIFTDNKR